MSAVLVETWRCFDIRRIDDLGNAVLGAELDAIQMAGGRVRGSLAFAARDGIVFGSGLIDGSVMISGPLSENAVTLLVVLRAGPGSRLWLDEVTEGNVGIVLPTDEFVFSLAAGSLYTTATLTPKRLRKEVVRQGLNFERGLIRETGLHSSPLKSRVLTCLREQILRIHGSAAGAGSHHSDVGSKMLRAVVNHYAEFAPGEDRRAPPTGPAVIVRLAQDYITRNLATPISVEALSRAATTSPRSLYRAFSEVLGDTPQSYARRLRLHKIRKELISRSGTNTVSDAAHKWAMGGDLGRLSKNYRDLFGENPSSTLALGRALQQDDALL